MEHSLMDFIYRLHVFYKMELFQIGLTFLCFPMFVMCP